MRKRRSWKTRIHGALRVLRDKPTLYAVDASVEFDDFQMIAAKEQGGVANIAGSISLRVPPGTLCRAEDGSLWVPPGEGETVILDESGGRFVVEDDDV